MPTANVAIFNAPAADKKGNIYFCGAVNLCESVSIALAADIVIVQVGQIIEEDSINVKDSPAMIPSRLITAIVLNPATEQTLGARHTDPLHFLTLNGGKKTQVQCQCTNSTSSRLFVYNK